jgi:hypothetical protein
MKKSVKITKSATKLPAAIPKWRGSDSRSGI